MTRLDDGEIYSDPQSYTITTDMRSDRCIAPTPQGRQCRSYGLNAASRQEVQNLHSDIVRSRDPRSIVRMMRSLVLARCNESGYHRVKLRDRPLCRAALAELYIDEYTRLGWLQIDVPRGLNVEDTDAIPPGTLEAYVPLQPETLDQIMRKPSFKSDYQHYVSSGVTYALSAPAHPGVVKIGYSSISAQRRLDDQRECLAGGYIVVEERFAFPERMEELIHQELLGQRRMVARCRTCGITHKEFFEINEEEVDVTFSEWAWLVNHDPLYNAKTYQLNTIWQQRLDGLRKLGIPATAYELKLAILREDAERERRANEQREKLAMIRREELERERLAQVKRAADERERLAKVKHEADEREGLTKIKREDDERERLARIRREDAVQAKLAKLKLEESQRQTIKVTSTKTEKTPTSIVVATKEVKVEPNTSPVKSEVVIKQEPITQRSTTIQDIPDAKKSTSKAKQADKSVAVTVDEQITKSGQAPVKRVTRSATAAAQEASPTESGSRLDRIVDKLTTLAIDTIRKGDVKKQKQVTTKIKELQTLQQPAV